MSFRSILFLDQPIIRIDYLSKSKKSRMDPYKGVVMKHILLIAVMIMSVACASTNGAHRNDSRFNDVEQTYSWR